MLASIKLFFSSSPSTFQLLWAPSGLTLRATTSRISTNAKRPASTPGKQGRCALHILPALAVWQGRPS